jgi:cytochrome c-type biogenesis protein
MINDIFTFLNSWLSGNYIFAVFAAFGWGVLSIVLSPCHLTSIPLVIGFINSKQFITVRKSFHISLIFSSGVLISIALIGSLTASLGLIMGNLGSTGNYFTAVVFFLVGLYLLDILRLPDKWTSQRTQMKSSEGKGIIQPLVIGLAFGLGLGPCTFAFMAPVLGIVFGIASSNLLYAVILLLAFAAGHCFVIVLAGTLTAKVQQFLNWTDNSRAMLYIKKICGALVIGGGVYFIYML